MFGAERPSAQPSGTQLAFSAWFTRLIHRRAPIRYAMFAALRSRTPAEDEADTERDWAGKTFRPTTTQSTRLMFSAVPQQAP